MKKKQYNKMINGTNPKQGAKKSRNSFEIELITSIDDAYTYFYRTVCCKLYIFTVYVLLSD